MAFRKYEMGMELLIINKMGSGLNKAAGQIHRFGAQVDAVSAKSAFAASSLMSMHGGFMLAAAAGIVANFAVSSVKYFVEIETKWAEVTTLMPGQLKSATDEMLQDVRDFSVEFGREAGQTINASYEAISAGIEDIELLDFLEDADKAARAGVASLDVAVDAMTTTLNVYNLETEEATRVSDAYFASILIGKTRFAELATSVGTYLPLMENLNVEYEEALLLQGALTAQGRSAAEAATQLASLATAFLKKGTTSDFLKDLNINVQEFLDDGNTMIELLHIMKVALEKDGKTFTEIMGRKEAALASLAVTNEKFVEDYVRGMLNLENATEIAYDKVEETTRIQMDKVKAHWADVKLSSGSQLLPVADALLDIADATLNVSTAMNTGRRYLDGFVASFVPLYDSYLELTDVMYEGKGVWADTEVTILDNYTAMESILGISEDLSEQIDIMSLTYENVTNNAWDYVEALNAQKTAADNAYKALYHLNWAAGQVPDGSYQMTDLDKYGVGKGRAGEGSPDLGTFDPLRIGFKPLTYNPIPTRTSSSSSSGGREDSFDIDAARYEFGVIDHDEYLAILEDKLADTGGRLTKEGAPIYREIEKVKAKRDKKKVGSSFDAQAVKYEFGASSHEEYLAILEERLAETGGRLTKEGAPIYREIERVRANILNNIEENGFDAQAVKYEFGALSHKEYLEILKDRLAETGGRLSKEGAPIYREIERVRANILKDIEENGFDAQAVKYEFGASSHEEYLAILEERLAETGGRLTKEGAPIYREIERVRANIRKDRDKEDSLSTDALKYEFGIFTHEEYLAILEEKLALTEGILSEKGAPIHRDIERVKENIEREKADIARGITEEVRKEEQFLAETYRQQDAEFGSGLISQDQYMDLLKERINKHSKYSSTGMRASGILKRLIEADASRSDSKEDLLWQIDKMSDADYEKILRDRADEAGGMGSVEGLRAIKALLDWLKQQSNDDEPMELIVKLDIDTDPAIVVRKDTIRFLTKREANRRGLPLAPNIRR